MKKVTIWNRVTLNLWAIFCVVCNLMYWVLIAITAVLILIPSFFISTQSFGRLIDWYLKILPDFGIKDEPGQ